MKIRLLVGIIGTFVLATVNWAVAGDKSIKSDNSGITVTEGWVRAVPPVSKHTAAYFTLHNASKAERTLKQVSSSMAAVAEIHEVYQDKGMSGMRPIDGLPVPAEGSVVLKPAGYHVMLINIKSPIKEGNSVDLTLKFTDGTTYTSQLPVRFSQSGGDVNHQDHSHHHHH